MNDNHLDDCQKNGNEMCSCQFLPFIEFGIKDFKNCFVYIEIVLFLSNLIFFPAIFVSISNVISTQTENDI